MNKVITIFIFIKENKRMVGTGAKAESFCGFLKRCKVFFDFRNDFFKIFVWISSQKLWKIPFVHFGRQSRGDIGICFACQYKICRRWGQRFALRGAFITAVRKNQPERIGHCGFADVGIVKPFQKVKRRADFCGRSVFVYSPVCGADAQPAVRNTQKRKFIGGFIIFWFYVAYNAWRAYANGGIPVCHLICAG